MHGFTKAYSRSRFLMKMQSWADSKMARNRSSLSRSDRSITTRS